MVWSGGVAHDQRLYNTAEIQETLKEKFPPSLALVLQLCWTNMNTTNPIQTRNIALHKTCHN